MLTSVTVKLQTGTMILPWSYGTFLGFTNYPLTLASWAPSLDSPGPACWRSNACRKCWQWSKSYAHWRMQSRSRCFLACSVTNRLQDVPKSRLCMVHRHPTTWVFQLPTEAKMSPWAIATSAVCGKWGCGSVALGCLKEWWWSDQKALRIFQVVCFFQVHFTPRLTF